MFILAINFFLFLIIAAKKEKAFKIFTAYIVIMAIIQAISTALQIEHRNNIFMSHYYFILQFLLLSYFYLEILTVEFQKKVVKLVIPICLTALGVQYYFNPELYLKFNLFEIFITSFSIIIFSMFHFYNMLNEKKNYYYISIGVFIYLFGGTFLFITGNLMNSLNKDHGNLTWLINSVLYLICQICFLIEFKQIYSKEKI
jgi:heme/copper-type cytochrome/quinol oxidase subunit 4